jgi:MYXO-CTERM domain-containing protein
MITTSRALAVLGVLAGMFLGGRAEAEPILSPAVTITFDRPIFSKGSDNVHIRFPGQFGGNDLAHVAAGRFSGSASNLVGVSESIFVDGVDDVFMYCYDLYDAIRGGDVVDYTINFGSIMQRTLDFIGAVNTVLNMQRGTLAFEAFDRYAWVRPDNAAQSAAIQLGLWESKYESDDAWDIGTGSFSASALHSGTGTALEGFFAAVRDPGNTPLEPQFAMLLQSPEYQDMITADPPGTVPTPAPLGLLLLGGLAALWQRRRSRA